MRKRKVKVNFAVEIASVTKMFFRAVGGRKSQNGTSKTGGF
jgi:hypothetical protein